METVIENFCMRWPKNVFKRALGDLQHGEKLVLYETLTRGYRIDFTLPYAEIMHPGL